jgi:hypothetical protein
MTRVNRTDTLLTELRDIKRRLRLLEAAQMRPPGGPTLRTALDPPPGLSAAGAGQSRPVASYSLNDAAVAQARRLIDTRQYVLDSDWGQVRPGADAENAYLDSHSWQDYARWHLALADGATDETKARYGFGYGDFRRVHRSALIACVHRAAEWRHKAIELAAHDLLQHLDRASA